MTLASRSRLPLSPAAAAPRDEPPVYEYSVLGGVLRSTLEFPELPPSDGGDVDWNFTIKLLSPPQLPTELLGEREAGTERYRLSRTSLGFRLEYSHAGCFDISGGGDELCWYPTPDGSLELARAIVLGPALSLALELRGYLCLHGSAVAVDGEAIAFLGPKFHGKSTIATALTAAGATLISDDLLAVAPGPPARLRAGVPSVRLWKDAASELEVDRLCSAVITGAKTTATGFAGRAMSAADAPLSAIYLLSPVLEAEDGPACWRTDLKGAAAAIALAHQTKLPASLVGIRAAGAQLRNAAATASTVPVYKLHIARDFTRLKAAVQQILDWHPASPPLDPTAPR